MTIDKSTYHNGRRVYEHACKYCGTEITLTYEQIDNDSRGNERYRYIARTRSESSIHNCIQNPGIESITKA